MNLWQDMHLEVLKDIVAFERDLTSLTQTCGMDLLETCVGVIIPTQVRYVLFLY